MPSALRAARFPFAVVGAACFAVWLALPHLLAPFEPKNARPAQSYREEVTGAYRRLAAADDPIALTILTGSAALLVALAVVLASRL